MPTVSLKAPPRATKVAYRDAMYHVEPDGTVAVPSFVVPEAVEAGCKYDGDHTQIDIRKELEAVGEDEHHLLSHFLNARGKADHYWDAHTHALSADLRSKIGETHVFEHGATVPTSITVTKGSLEFHSTAHDLLTLAVISSKLLPPNTRVARITETPSAGNFEAGVKGELKMAAGKTADDIVTGTDPAATVTQKYDGHMLADILDDYHQRFHESKTRGRIVFLTHAEKKALALSLHDAETKA